ncbi:COP3-like protein [Mya arenaria]|uniref:COP3-like protein n=1 Tax=Mya arenaria TaxID=6604 RepID=A0ABY7EV46_MYAAR|nr:COP3-like protein [Mya arenaria]
MSSNDWFMLVIKMRLEFVLLLVLAALSIAYAGVCDRAPDVDGCSVPGNLPYPYKNTFRPDCNKHDICYSCGNHYGIRRSTCDIRFYRNIKSTCNTSPKVSNRNVCKVAAADYYSKVLRFGWIFFVKKSPSWCSQAYVKRCIR